LANILSIGKERTRAPNYRTALDRSIRIGQPLRVAMRKDPIRMVAHDPRWSVSFEQQRQHLEPVLGAWLVRPIEHIGSTSIPGLEAKPIVDMVAVVADIAPVRDAVLRLGGIGWIHAPEPTDEAFRELSLCTPSVQRRTHHLHVVEETSAGWREWIAFRDYLRDHADLASEYGELKTRLASQLGADPNQRDAYRAAKAPWIRRVTDRALGAGA
jgi:GrpB-like predicted nucleotidyltransferase (UPF0157 family)